jgi:uncharacterized protein (DUF362 family)
MQLRPAIAWIDPPAYGRALPHHPPERYPELGFLPDATDPENRVYTGVRSLLAGLGYDAARFGTPDWSPLSDLVRPGGKVVIKPNYVRHYHEAGGPFDAVVTHLSVLRPLIDYALRAVGPAGQVIVADAPQYDCDVGALLAATGLPALLAWYADTVGRRVEWRDLRVQYGRHERGVVIERRALAGDPEGYEAVDLGDASELARLASGELCLLRGADYDEEVTIRHHSGGRNQYLVSRTVLSADLVINAPKIKTHKKTGVTLSMKNLIGINGDKNWLPHYRAGFAAGGGDEFPAPDAYARLRRAGAEVARRLLKRGVGAPLFRRLRGLEDAAGLGARVRNGNWWGNDTIWRTTLDLNKILYCGDANGRVSPPEHGTGSAPARRVLDVYDGVVAGEGDGPMAPSPRPVGLLVAGEDPLAADVAIAWLMGFDWRRIPVLARAQGALAGGVRISGFDGDAARLPVLWIDARGAREMALGEVDCNLHFEPHPGWKGHMERSDPLRDARGKPACAS